MVPNVVFDCNVYFQAFIAPYGPAGACLDAVAAKHFKLFLSNAILAELLDVCGRPPLVKKFSISEDRLQRYFTTLRDIGNVVDAVPHVFTYDRDPKDEHYVDLAIATNSELVVSRDRDLLALADPQDPTGQDFMARYPAIRIVTPVDLVARLGRS